MTAQSICPGEDVDLKETECYRLGWHCRPTEKCKKFMRFFFDCVDGYVCCGVLTKKHIKSIESYWGKMESHEFKDYYESSLNSTY